VPRKPGAKMLIPSVGEPVGTVGGGKVEETTLIEARKLLEEGGPPTPIEIDLTEESSCGGRVELFLEPHHSRRRIVLIGAGHVGLAVARQMADLGWDVTVMDPRAERFARPEFDGCRKIRTEFLDAVEKIPFSPDLFVLVMTPEHKFDEEIAARCLDRPWHWLGVMGSVRKAAQIKRHLLERGLSEERVSRLRIPVGLEIGSESPEEIAVSIAAELIQLTSAKSGLATAPAETAGGADG